MDHGHSRADARNLALHQAALSKLRVNPELKRPCLELVLRWLGRPEHAPARHWLDQWLLSFAHLIGLLQQDNFRNCATPR